LNAPLPSWAATGLDRRLAKRHRWILSIVVLIVTLYSGPTAQAQSWAKRQYQNITARFNGLYYAQLRYDEAMQEIHRNHKDDYAQWLPVFVESLDASVASGSSAFEESIKKCSNLIQRKEHSRWVDDGFLLIGQCYYLRRDYFDAIETFQYVIKKYKGQPNADHAAAWLVRSYTASGQYGPAQGALEKALENPRAVARSRAMLYLAAAECQLAQKRPVKAAEYLEGALPYSMSAAQRRRTHFLLGQLYLQIESRKAPVHFQKAQRGRPDPELRFQCKIKSVTAYTDARSGARNARRILNNLIKSKKYVPYRDVLYFELALLDQADQKTTDAEKNLRLALTLSLIHI
jgi:tetratricopeptide (TPR) repeat protein